MSSPREPHREHPNTYFVQDSSNQDELARLQIQDEMLTTGMGGSLSEQPDPGRFRRVLDVGCGTGGWLIEVAKTYPTISELVGVDISARMLEYARSQAEARQVGDRVSFQVRDALRSLEFPAQSFDLVNQRLGWSYLRTWEWPKLIDEFRRVTRKRGIIRITEGGWMTGNSDALMKLHQLALKASFASGHLFVEDENTSIIQRLPGLLEQYGLQQVHTYTHDLTFPAGTTGGEHFREDLRHLFHVSLPFFQKWTPVPEDYKQIYQRMLEETRQPGFVGRWTFLTAWGTC
ncbi:MAG TPA: class I SAM-dependent methyltransferase [Ktedonobacteraceae bacterium]|nr:class I SAM-dependent methyltransferase [Ktedonobacteraceae bacterium]